ncbi:hypothetical protein ACH347_20985 [Saccharopolyspora sp. 5N102]|uniref:hypothetical protein n=1 Tax=Saccharopolyspora sp. 5N102 TaxID=3375155 RepID=UPI0037A76E8C
MIENSDEPESLAVVLARFDATDVLAVRLSAAYDHARQLGLRAFPTLPAFENTDVVEVSADQLELADFVALAAELGTRLLYIDAERFSVEDLPGIDDEDRQDHYELREVRRAAARFDGHVVRLEVTFVHDGVWHVWSEAAPATTTLDAATSSAAGWRRLQTQREDESQELNADECTRLFEVLLDNRDFRAAPNRSRRTQLARQLPEFAELFDRGFPAARGAWHVISEACDQADAAQQEKVRELRSRLPELANLLREDEDYQAARTAAMRKQVAAEFLPGYSDGYPVPPAIRDELLALARTLPSPVQRDTAAMF